MPRERVLITVKTYPSLSRKFGETVCTAGVREDGSWVRIYPVPFRRLGEAEQYRKYDWVACDLRPSTSDPRPETHHPMDWQQLVPVGHMGTEDKWRQRRELLLGHCEVFTSKERLIAAARENRASLAVFKPSAVTGFHWKGSDRQWDPGKLAEMRQRVRQGNLFDQCLAPFRLVDPLPYSFHYDVTDAAGNRSTYQILDWELGALFWKYARQDEKGALDKVRQKYFDDFAITKDLHLFMGTTAQYHSRGQNPWTVIGVLPLPFDNQPRLL